MNLSENPVRPEGFDENLLELRSLQETDQAQFQQRIEHLKDIAFHPSCVGYRNEFWVGWKTEDFEQLLQELNAI